MAMQNPNPFWGFQDTGLPSQPGGWGTTPQPGTSSPSRMGPQPPSTGANPFFIPQRPPMQTPPGLYGRVVASPDDIMPNEVPMDGTPSLFPKEDFSCIYGRKWMPDGRIVPVTFVPQVETPVDPEPNQNGASLEEVLSRLSDIESLLKSLPFSVDTKKGTGSSTSKPKEGEKK